MALTHAKDAATTRPEVVPGFEHIQRNWDRDLQRWNAKILPGDYFVTRQDEAINTVLGSCISACVRDPGLRIGGMNHFMLPEDTSDGTSCWLDASAGLATRYGSFAMESLINDLMKLGARRDRLEVKLFGGGKILSSMTDVGARNIAFVRSWLSLEGFGIVAQDVGGIQPRRIVYLPTSGTVKLKRLRPLDGHAIADREQRYFKDLNDKPAGETDIFDGDVELFD